MAILASLKLMNRSEVPLSLLRELMGDSADSYVGRLMELKVVEAVRIGRGFRLSILDSPELEPFISFIRGGVDEESFVKALIEAARKVANPATGYADLGEVARVVCGRLGITQGEFLNELTKVLGRLRGRVIMAGGGSLRVRVGSNYYGLIKVVGDVK